MNRITSDPEPISTLPTSLKSPFEDGNVSNAIKPQFHGIINNTLFNNHPHPSQTANPFDQRMPPQKVASQSRDPRLRQASVPTPLSPTSASSKPVTTSLLPFNRSLPSAPAPPAPILPPGWQQDVPGAQLTESRPKQVATAYGWKGWPAETPPLPLPPKMETTQEPPPLSQLLAQQLEKGREGEDGVGGVSPPRLLQASPPIIGLDMPSGTTNHTPSVLIPPSFVKTVRSSNTPHLLDQPVMVVCPLCPAPGLVRRADLDHARQMHRYGTHGHR